MSKNIIWKRFWTLGVILTFIWQSKSLWLNFFRSAINFPKLFRFRSWFFFLGTFRKINLRCLRSELEAAASFEIDSSFNWSFQLRSSPGTFFSDRLELERAQFFIEPETSSSFRSRASAHLLALKSSYFSKPTLFPFIFLQCTIFSPI